MSVQLAIYRLECKYRSIYRISGNRIRNEYASLCAKSNPIDFNLFSSFSVTQLFSSRIRNNLQWDRCKVINDSLSLPQEAWSKWKKRKITFAHTSSRANACTWDPTMSQFLDELINEITNSSWFVSGLQCNAVANTPSTIKIRFKLFDGIFTEHKSRSKCSISFWPLLVRSVDLCLSLCRTKYKANKSSSSLSWSSHARYTVAGNFSNFIIDFELKLHTTETHTHFDFFSSSFSLAFNRCL